MPEKLPKLPNRLVRSVTLGLPVGNKVGNKRCPQVRKLPTRVAQSGATAYLTARLVGKVGNLGNKSDGIDRKTMTHGTGS